MAAVKKHNLKPRMAFRSAGPRFLSFVRLKHNWSKPEGHDTGIKVYHCMTRDKQPFIVKNKSCVTWYTCGPTVYDASHIGHASCYVKLDIIKRILQEHFKLGIVSVMNITDIDDKIIARSNALNIPMEQLTQRVEKDFWKDLDRLGVGRPDYVLHVTKYISSVQAFIEKLIADGSAYVAENKSVYFDTQSYGNYGKLQNIGVDTAEKVSFKKCNMDFALWKASKPGEVYWESPWGPGRPGWHIECSALATYAFGSELDIHAGGIDLRFPHHENEEAQSCAFHNKTQWVNYWLHTGHLHYKDSQKMSKSLKNTISISEMLQQTSAEAFRMACIMSHYRSHMEFSIDYMKTAGNLLASFTNFLENCRNYSRGLVNADVNSEVLLDLISRSRDEIHNALVDDFNTPLVVKILNELVSVVNGMLRVTETNVQFKSPSVMAAANLVKHTLSTLGVGGSREESAPHNSRVVEIVDLFNKFRQDVRQLGISSKDKELLRLCDDARDNLHNCGIVIKDHGKVSSWSI